MNLSRRQFLRAGAASPVALGLAGPLLADEPKKTSANDRLTLGFIGMGVQNRGHLSGFLNMKDIQVVAVCDVVAERRDHAKQMVEKKYGADKKGEYKGCDAYTDFRKIIERQDIDAVVIATPDHWHTIPCILAAQAKKDIYCEKPLTHDIGEGRRLVDAVKKNDVIFQVGSQQRSEFDNRFRLAVELVR